MYRVTQSGGLPWLATALLAVVFASALLLASAKPASADPGYRSEVMTDSPRGYWRAGETSGTSAADETANNNPGTYLGGVTLGVGGAVVGDSNKAARFDGVNDQISMGDPPSGALDFGTGDFSAEAWIKTTVNNDQIVMAKHPSSGPYWDVTVTDDSGSVGWVRAKLDDGSVVRQVYGPAVRVDDGNWHHVAVLFDRDAAITIYVDGTYTRRTTGAMANSVNNSAPLLVGGAVAWYPPFTGDIDEVALYDTLLPASRIQAHYTKAKAADITAPSVSLTTPANASTTNDTTPTFAGVAGLAPGDSATVALKIYSGSNLSGPLVRTLTTTKDAAGAWAIDATPALGNGTYTARAEQSDTAGNVGLSASKTFTVVQPPPPSPSDPVLLAAGDIANCTSGAVATAALLDTLPGTIATLGDNAYESGSASEFANCYEPTWGRHKARTHPAVGDHEYETPHASGYYDYFGSAAGDPSKGYYSYDLGAWHVVVLNTECSEVGGCQAGSPQEQWLRGDLASHAASCTLAVLPSPRFSSGLHGNNGGFEPFWNALRDYGAEVALSGDDHDYERFAPQTPTGYLDLAGGISEFVVGTGGRSHYPFSLGTLKGNSQARNDDTFGVLKLTLHPSGYDWEFVPEAGKTFSDSGSRSCH
jgi:hypothetical protein